MLRTRLPRLVVAAGLATSIALAGPGSLSAVAQPAAPQVTVVSSPSIAGYDQLRGGNFGAGPQTVAATVVVPTVTCGPLTNRGITADVGIYGSGSSAYYQAGVFVGCYGGLAHYWPDITINGHETKYNVGADAKPGDTITIRVSLGATQSSASVVDHSRALTKTLTGVGSTSWGGPFVGDDARYNQKGQRLGVPSFGTLSFSQCTFDGAAFGGATAVGLVGYKRVNSTGTVQIGLGPFGPAGAGFSTYFRHF
jgi:hypothetical protein